jgi:hypothetical protein
MDMNTYGRVYYNNFHTFLDQQIAVDYLSSSERGQIYLLTALLRGYPLPLTNVSYHHYAPPITSPSHFLPSDMKVKTIRETIQFSARVVKLRRVLVKQITVCVHPAGS